MQIALARHQLRREQGIPTLSVLIGTAGEAETAWRQWASTSGRQVAVRTTADGEIEAAPETAVLFIHQISPATAAPGQPENILAQVVEHLWQTLGLVGANQGEHPLALVVSPEDGARFLSEAPLDRTRTLFAEGSVVLSSEFSAAQEPRGEDTLAQVAPSLARQMLPEAAASNFAAARAAFRRVEAGLADAEETSRARSAAERFLADLLAELPETRGLFELNVRLDFCFGPMRAEVDLLAAGLWLAVEIDGYYHFRDQEGYRRDRRKDALLQRQGYLVLRFLAEDVVTRLEEILEEIRATVAFRRATRA